MTRLSRARRRFQVVQACASTGAAALSGRIFPGMCIVKVNGDLVRNCQVKVLEGTLGLGTLGMGVEWVWNLQCIHR
jgi:hypothetical protein